MDERKYLIDPATERRSQATTQLEAGINFDHLDQWSRGSKNPKLLREAIDSTLAMALLLDLEIPEKYHRNPKAMHAFWKLMNSFEFISEGPGDWYRTVFETVRERASLYEEEWEPSPFRVQYGKKFSYYTRNTQDKWVARAIAWLEGDESFCVSRRGKWVSQKLEPINKPKSRHRDEGDWMITFENGRWPNGKMKTVTVWVSAEAFHPHRFKDEYGQPYGLELKRGANHIKRAGGLPVVDRFLPNGEHFPAGFTSWQEAKDNFIERLMKILSSADEDETVQYEDHYENQEVYDEV